MNKEEVRESLRSKFTEMSKEELVEQVVDMFMVNIGYCESRINENEHRIGNAFQELQSSQMLYNHFKEDTPIMMVHDPLLNPLLNPLFPHYTLM